MDVPSRRRFGVRALASLAFPLALAAACGRNAPPAQPGESDYLSRCDLPEGLAAACSACGSGSPAACLSVARAYERGEQLPRDPLGMVAFERRACELGSGRGCSNLGLSYRNGTGVAAQPDRGDALWDRGCAMSERTCDAEGLAYECVAAGTCRLGREPLAARHITHADAACSGGDRLGCRVAYVAWTDDPQHDPGQAAVLLGRMCSAGDRGGCAGLAMHRWLGLGVQPDPDAARATFTELCDQGYPTACHAAKGYMEVDWMAPYLVGAEAPYPRDAINAGMVRDRELPKDRVVIGFCVASDGSAAKTVILEASGNEDVDDGAAKGVRAWRFPSRPAIERDLCMQIAFHLPPRPGRVDPSRALILGPSSGR